MDIPISKIGAGKGVKVSYSAVKRAVMACELDKKSAECKRSLKEIGVEDVFDA
jgi:hypothetical protein